MISALLMAQALAAPIPAAPPNAPSVISYTAGFFADQRPTNALEMVERLPGFVLDTGGAVRGFEGAAGNVLIDGRRPAAKSDSLDAILIRIPASQVARIDLIRGGAPGIDMQGKTILANVVLNHAGKVRGLVSAGVVYSPRDGRALYTVRGEGSGESGGRNWELSLRSARIIDSTVGSGNDAQSDGLGRAAVDALITAKADALAHTATGAYELPLLGGRLRLNGRIASNRNVGEETDTTSGSPTTVGSIEETSDLDKKLDTEVGLRWTRALGMKSNLDIVALRQTRDETDQELLASGPVSASPSLTRFDLRRESSESILRGVLSHHVSDRLSWDAGAEGAVNDLSSRTVLQTDGTPVALPAANVDVRETRGEVFLKGVWRPMSAWTTEFTMTEEASRIASSGDVQLSKELSFAKPSLAVTWAPSQTLQMRIRLERTVGQLNFNDFVASAELNKRQISVGNPDLNPETAWLGEAEIEQQFWSKGVIIVAARHYQIDDVIDRTPVIADGVLFDQPGNIGRGTKDELSVSFTLPLSALGASGVELSGQATSRRSEVLDPATGRRREISGLHATDWVVHLVQDLPHSKIHWGLDVFGDWREDYYRVTSIEIRKMRPYLGLFVDWKPKPGLEFRFEFDDLTDRHMRDRTETFFAARGSSPLAHIDDRDTHLGQVLFFRVRQSIGG